MTKTIPLSATLRVQVICIIIGNSREKFLDVMLENLSSECRRFRDAQGKTVTSTPCT